MEQLIAVPFEPVPGLAEIATNRKEWARRSERLRVAMVLACRIIEKDKAGLTQAAADALSGGDEAEAWEAMVDEMHAVAEAQKAIVKLLEAAHLRGLAALAAAAMAAPAPTTPQ